MHDKGVNKAKVLRKMNKSNVKDRKMDLSRYARVKGAELKKVVGAGIRRRTRDGARQQVKR